MSKRERRSRSRSTVARSQVDAGQFLIAAAEDAGRLHPALLLPPAPEACRDVPDVPRRGVRATRARPFSRRVTSLSPTGWSSTRPPRRCTRPRTACSSSCSSTIPLDCPVCDKGGECPLQDQTLAYGPGESRFIEEKRHFAKPIALSPLVLLDRERCIQCGRCTRFAAEIAGEPLIDFVGRGDAIEVAIAEGYVFSSVFSGNTVQICPVGRAHLDSLPVHGSSVGSRPGRVDVHDLCGRMPGCGAVVDEPGDTACSASTSTRSTRAGCATRAGTATRPSTRENRLTEPARLRSESAAETRDRRHGPKR